jgi:hypothetical protein
VATVERVQVATETVANEPEKAHTERVLAPEQKVALIATVKARFEANMKRHEGIEWANVEAKLLANPEKMWSLNEMERTGGEPDVVGYDKRTDKFMFFDCSAESPVGRRHIVYDRRAQDLLTKNYPRRKCLGNAVDMAEKMGIKMLDERQYQDQLQILGEFDLNTWSWIKTSQDRRRDGGAVHASRCKGGEHNLGVIMILDRAFPVGARLASGGFRGALRV